MREDNKGKGQIKIRNANSIEHNMQEKEDLEMQKQEGF